VRQAAPQRVIDRDVSAGGVDADLRGADHVGVPRPTDREEHRIDIESPLLPAGSVSTVAPPPLRSSRLTCVEVSTTMPRSRKDAVSASDTSWSARATSLGPASISVTSTPKSAKIDASWQPVSAPPTTAAEAGSAVRLRRSS
jgi:hypothetical protein